MEVLSNSALKGMGVTRSRTVEGGQVDKLYDYRLKEGGVTRSKVVEGGVVLPPGTHVANQGRGVKPNTGTGRPGCPYRGGDTPTSRPGQTVLPTGLGVLGGGPEQSILPGKSYKELEVEGERYTMKMLGGEMRWLEMSREEDQIKILVEERSVPQQTH